MVKDVAKLLSAQQIILTKYNIVCVLLRSSLLDSVWNLILIQKGQNIFSKGEGRKISGKGWAW